MDSCSFLKFLLVFQLPNGIVCNPSRKRKRAERCFVDFKINLMLHCGNEFRMEVCSFRFKFDDIVPR